jgi:hypothetical protein
MNESFHKLSDMIISCSEIKGHALSSESWLCWLAFLVDQPCQMDQRG